MDFHAHQHAQCEGGIVLPSISKVLHAMRTSNSSDVLGGVFAHLNVQQLATMWGGSSLSLMSLAAARAPQSESSAHSSHGDDSRCTTDSAPGSPGSPDGESTSADERREGTVYRDCARALAPMGHESQPVDLLGPALQKAVGKVASKRAARAEMAAQPGALAGTAAYWPGRKWRERRDKKYAGEEDSRQSSHLKVAITGLYKALATLEAKTALATAMRQYLAAEMTPEAFAETIKLLVDQHNIIVPSGTLALSNEGASVCKRPYEENTEPTTSARRSRENKRARNRSHPPANRGAVAAKPCPAIGIKVEEANGAWEALVSVCSML